MKTFGFILLILATVGCSNNKETSSIQMETFEVEVVELYQKDFVPGVESNLRLTRDYVLEFTGKINEEVTILNLVVDSVKVPVKHLSLDNEKVADVGAAFHGDFLSIKVSATRLIYNPYSQRIMSEEIEYETHKYEIEEGALALEYESMGEVKIHNFGVLEKKETLYGQ